MGVAPFPFLLEDCPLISALISKETSNQLNRLKTMRMQFSRKSTESFRHKIDRIEISVKNRKTQT